MKRKVSSGFSLWAFFCKKKNISKLAQCAVPAQPKLFKTGGDLMPTKGPRVRFLSAAGSAVW